MPSIEGVCCWISTTSKDKLEEYWETDDTEVCLQKSTRAETCYVQSEEGAEFTISVEVDKDFAEKHGNATHLRAVLSLDGIIYKPYPPFASVGCATIIRGYRLVGQRHYYQTMKFEKVELTEEKVAGSTVTQDLGEITVTMYRFKGNNESQKTVTSKRLSRTDSTPGSSTDSVARRIYEKELKGKDIGHVVGEGRVQDCAKTYTYTEGDYMDPVNGEPYLKFRFLYRFERALKGLGFLTRTPSPAPPPPHNLAELSALTKEEMLARLIAIQTQQGPVIKAEPTDDVGLSAESHRAKRPRRSAPVTIDLTDD